jgi:endonuclease/exonuclease/phosphatase family metal-dependent hydrolase
VLDSLAIVKNIESPPVNTEWWYGPTVGPNPNNTAPFHVIRCAGALNGWIIGSADLPPTGNDTPGEENDCSSACLTCYGDIDQSQRVDVDDIDEFVDVLLGLEHSVCADVNLDGEINGLDIRRFIQLILANGGAGTSCLPAGQRDVVRCDNADPPNDCPDAVGGYCQYEVEFNQAGLAPCVVTANPGPNQLVEGEIICVPCPDNEVCGTPDERVRFRWVNQDGLGNDCIFFARLVSSSCTSCPENKRFDDAPPPLAIKLMTWNLLNYNGSGRTLEYQAVLNVIQADIVAVQEMVGTSSANTFLNTVLNGPGGPGGYSMATFVDSSDSDNALYYRSTRIGFSGSGDHTNVATSPRWTDRWRLTINGFTGNESQLYVYSTHLKASNTSGDAEARETAALAIRAHANNLPAGTNFVIVGDMNLYTSAEAAYSAFTGSTGNNNGRVFDPINRPGNWNGNSAFRDIHTQSTHSNNANPPPGAAIGGLDDRFDFILCSSALLDGVALTYRVGSYHAFGNDGLHFNSDINDPPTIPEGAAVADALHGASDHLPVVMEILLP